MNFNDALPTAAEIALRHLGTPGRKVTLVRDLFGKIRIVLPEDQAAAAEALGVELTDALGLYTYEPGSLFLQDADVADALQSSRLVAISETGAQVLVIDRQLTGTEWNARPIAEATHPSRFTLFSMKGGVGRSTTATILAWHLARKGKRVLIFDLDLESPGIGATLLGQTLPRFGIIDWFVEDALGQGDSLLGDMVADSKLQDGTDGRIAVVPAFGTDTGDYLSKLGRAYLERGPNGHEPWPDRLKRLVNALEQQEKPDVVLLDSRTGLDDTSAALVLAMGANTLLFAVDTAQTWTAYRFLFEHWKRHPNLPEFRDKLWLLGATVPDTETQPYLDGMRDRAWELFVDTIYESTGAVANPDAFTFAANDEAGNHYPRPIFWQRNLMAFNPLENWTDQFVTAGYQSFLDWFDQFLLAEPEAP